MKIDKKLAVISLLLVASHCLTAYVCLLYYCYQTERNAYSSLFGYALIHLANLRVLDSEDMTAEEKVDFLKTRSSNASFAATNYVSSESFLIWSVKNFFSPIIEYTVYYGIKNTNEYSHDQLEETMERAADIAREYHNSRLPSRE